MKPCTTPDCPNPHSAKGLCERCYKAKYYQANKARMSAAAKEYVQRPAVKARIRGQRARLRYWTEAQYHNAVATQAGRCAACGQPPSGVRGLHCDHDHATKAPRELLCHGCNLALGHTKDSLVRLEQLAAYLRKHGK